MRETGHGGTRLDHLHRNISGRRYGPQRPAARAGLDALDCTVRGHLLCMPGSVENPAALGFAQWQAARRRLHRITAVRAVGVDARVILIRSYG